MQMHYANANRNSKYNIKCIPNANANAKSNLNTNTNEIFNLQMKKYENVRHRKLLIKKVRDCNIARIREHENN